MRFFIVNTDYGESIKQEYDRDPRLAEEPFDRQLQHRHATFWGTSDSYSWHLRRLGHDAIDVVANHPHIQRQWYKENTPRRARIRSTSVFRRIRHERRRLDDILERQVVSYEPDVIYNMAMETVTSTMLRHLKRRTGLMVIGQHAAAFTPGMEDLSAYDLVLSSLPNQVDEFRRRGVRSEYFRLGFDPRAVSAAQIHKRSYGCVHIGSYGDVHRERVSLLEVVARRVKTDFWGVGAEALAPDSPILRSFHGFVGGVDMYRTLASSKIVLGKHGDREVTGGYANRMGLFETTGMGALLLTDAGHGLDRLFDVGREIVVYESPDDLVTKAHYYLSHDAEREEIAQAGQQRTLDDHSYERRMWELVAILEDLCR